MSRRPGTIKDASKEPVWRGFDWDALTPVCKGCGQKSGDLRGPSLCPTCRGSQPAPAAPAPSTRTKRRTRRSASPTRPRVAQRSGGRPQNPLDAELVVRQYQEGAQIAGLAEQHHVGTRRIKDVLDAAGVREERRGGQNRVDMSPELVATVRRLYVDECLSITAVGERIGKTHKQVLLVMKRAGIERRQNQSRTTYSTRSSA